MIDRSEQAGLFAAVLVHIVAFGLLSASFIAERQVVKPLQPSVDVSLVDEVALVATAPQATTPPAESRSPDLGGPADAPPPAAKVAAAAPLPPPPVARAKPTPPPKPRDIAKPAPVKMPVPDAAKKPEKVPPKTAAKAVTLARPDTAAPSSGTDPVSKKPRPRSSRLGDDFLKGLTDQPSTSKSLTPKAAVIDARALGAIQDAIRRQIQPCADRQVNPGPGANEIITVLNLRLNPDGTLAVTPTVVRQTGADGEGARYSRRVIDLGIAAFKGCSPLRLPPEYYQTANGGWNNINYNWQLR